MSKKISEYFKVNPKIENSAKIDNKSTANSSEVRECQVIINDIKDQIGKNSKLFEEISFNESKKSGTKLMKNGNKTCKFCHKEYSSTTSLQNHVKSFIQRNLKLLIVQYAIRSSLSSIFWIFT